MKRVMVIILVLGSLVTAGRAWCRDNPDVKQLLKLVRDRDLSIRQKACELNQLGPSAADSSDTLVAALGDDNEEMRQIVTSVLARIGKGAVPELTRALSSDRTVIRRQALLALSTIGQDARPALGGISDLVKDPSQEIRGFALAALLCIDPGSATTLAALKKGLEDPDRGVRLGVVYSLEGVKDKTAPGQELILEALKNQEWEVRLAAAGMLGRSGGKIKGALSALKETLKDDNPRVRNSAALAMVTLEPDQVAAPLEVLIPNLRHKESEIRMGAAYILGEMGPAAGAAVGPLREMARDPRLDISQAASRALNRIQSKP